MKWILYPTVTMELRMISLDCDDSLAEQATIHTSNHRPTRRSRNATNSAGIEPNIISLDSDDDSSLIESQSQLLDRANNSFESENYEIRIKIKWGMSIETFTHRKFQKFDDIFAKLAAKESADTGCILLNLDDRIVYPSDTPDSLGYKSHQFISGRILKETVPILPKGGGSSTGSDNSIMLKVQMEKRRKPIHLQINKSQTMSVLVIKCAEELKCEPGDIRLYFDGELVDNNCKPEDLELEGDELMDIRFVK
uniref:Ubiquitin-like domain-containing protein n=1 Tax=Anopheles dirus TaxID=7168 RepID=A0A182NQ90_9DIPT